MQSKLAILIIFINLIKRCSLTRGKLTPLYKHLMTKTTLTYISNKQNLEYCSVAASIACQTITMLHARTHTHRVRYQLLPSLEFNRMAGVSDEDLSFVQLHITISNYAKMERALLLVPHAVLSDKQLISILLLHVCAML